MALFTLHPTLLLASTLIATICALTLAMQLRRVKKILAQCRTELANAALGSSETAPDIKVPQAKPQSADFTDSLHQATLKQRLEKGPDWRQPPEKYRYAAALADQGMDAEGIAAVLQFPIEAAQQIITLKSAAQIDPATTGPDK
ncbi:hypothetical protein A7E78_05455 [Syntrophotalea acetylenivorans]|uniref:DUF2802 domain-containing protein n=1 Tax=Syntrophotalea acetylenivorans TaxID=1842532 RepID=A0A1L3GN21_9BACT|nr:hypothetical protein [Syntrophotalea acetylenivorans]APG27337.1 hypothetical protein A7E78_05455 [Syntrophotalea acetylenivorans]